MSEKSFRWPGWQDDPRRDDKSLSQIIEHMKDQLTTPGYLNHYNPAKYVSSLDASAHESLPAQIVAQQLTRFFREKPLLEKFVATFDSTANLELYLIGVIRDNSQYPGPSGRSVKLQDGRVLSVQNAAHFARRLVGDYPDSDKGVYAAAQDVRADALWATCDMPRGDTKPFKVVLSLVQDALKSK